MKKILFLLMCFVLSALSVKVKGQNINIILHFYGPLSANRAAFEDSVMIFYDVYKVSNMELIAHVGVAREDHSSTVYKQPFVGKDDKNSSFRDQVKEVKNADNRLKSQPNPMLLKPYGLCQYERPSSIELNHFYLGKTTVAEKHQYATCQEVKAAIQKLVDSKIMDKVHIHFISSVDENYKDSKYKERTFPYMSLDYSGKPFLNTDAKDRLSVFSENFLKEINAGKLNTEQYFVNGTVRIGDSLDVISSKLNAFFFENTSFSKWLYIYKKNTVDFISFDSGLLVYSFWTEVECYRPEMKKYEFRLVRMKVGLNREGKIVSLGEVESLGKTYAETNKNPKKMMSKGSSVPPPSPSERNENEVFAFVSEEPVYIGGMDRLYSDISKNITYPEKERNAFVSGTVYVAFIVEWDGSISDVVVERGVENGRGLDKAAVEAVSKLGFFRPAQMNGQSVRYRYRVPVKFTLK